MDALFKRGVEEMLAGELDGHLGYEKHTSATVATNATARRQKPSKPLKALTALMCHGTEKAALSHNSYRNAKG